MRLALLGYGKVARAVARLAKRQRGLHSFPITGIQTRHGMAIGVRGLPLDPAFGPPPPSVEEFLDRAAAQVLVELTPHNPVTGEPAISHIRAAFARGLHVVTANKGPIAHAFSELRDTAGRRGVEFRFESAVMGGAPVFNLFRHNFPGVKVLGFTGVLNSTSNLVIEAMERGGSFDEGLAEARSLGIAVGDASYDTEGWDSAAKTAVIANVLMDARVTPQMIPTKGITRLTPERVRELAAQGKTVRIVSRARGSSLRVRAEVIDKTDILASVKGVSNLILFDTDLMGRTGTISIEPTVDQTAYGVWSDLMDIVRSRTSGVAPQGSRNPEQQSFI